MTSQRFPKKARLLKSTEFRRVFARRGVASDGHLVVYACENGQDRARIGLVVSRKVGCAVVRNRWKRCLRESFRVLGDDLPAGVDLVVLPKAGAEPDAMAIRRSLLRLAQRASRRLRASKRGLPRASSDTRGS